MDGVPSAEVKWMSLALSIARRGEGATMPNPPVGAVLVRNGRCVGRGFHAFAGGPHAEINAIRSAGVRARGSTLYVTLEPCSTHGRTPPCVDAIVSAGISRVVAGVSDPNPRHYGRAAQILRRHGITMKTGVCAVECRRMIEPFAKWISTRRPFVTLKLAVSLDGRIADSSGVSQWISGPDSRAWVQQLRSSVDAILVGASTVKKDNPRLTVRGVPGRADARPLRVVLDTLGTVSARARVFANCRKMRTLVATTSRCPDARKRAYQKRGADVAVFPARRGMVDINAVMRFLGKRGILHVLCEGGGMVAESLARSNAIDRYVLFIAPVLIGGKGKPAIGGRGWSLRLAPRLEINKVERCGTDLLVECLPGH